MRRNAAAEKCFHSVLIQCRVICFCIWKIIMLPTAFIMIINSEFQILSMDKLFPLSQITLKCEEVLFLFASNDARS